MSGGDPITRRRFVGALAGGLGVAPTAAGAQPTGKVYRIGLLGGSPPTAPDASARLWEGLFEGLRELGYSEGQNVVFEGRWYGERIERLPALAAELVSAGVDVIVTGAAPAPEAARSATTAIPIVFASHPDPVASGLVASLARPGGNVTGLSLLAPELAGKQLQLLKEAVPGVSRVAVLWHPTVRTHTVVLRQAEAAARSLKMQLQVLEARGPGDLAAAFAAMTRGRAGALIVLSSPVFFAERSRITELAAQHRLPAVYWFREFAEAGGLMAYGPSLRENWRRAAVFVDKILRGARPGDLPIEQPTTFDLVVNLKAARALGLAMPSSLLQRANEVIR